MPRSLLIRRKSTDSSTGWLYLMGRKQWSEHKKAAMKFANDFACSRVIIAEDLKDAVVISA